MKGMDKNIESYSWQGEGEGSSRLKTVASEVQKSNLTAASTW